MTDEEKLRKIYREEGWGLLAEEAGFDPVNTESSARAAFRFCAEKIAALSASPAGVVKSLEAIRSAGLKARDELLERMADGGTVDNDLADYMERIVDACVNSARIMSAIEPAGVGVEMAVRKHLEWFERFICDENELNSSTPRKVARNAQDAAAELRAALTKEGEQ